MNTHSVNPISQLLTLRRHDIQEEWVTEVSRLWSKLYPGLVSEEELRWHIPLLVDELIRLFDDHGSEIRSGWSLTGPLANVVQEVSANRTRQGFKPVDTALFVFTLKHLCAQRLVVEMSNSPTELAQALTLLDVVSDQLSLACFESYVETRERVIAQQSISLQELSSPVIRLWDQLLLLPLVGVIDTFRARQVTERLLDAITRFEATVTIIDVTGVPVFDTSVARHIMKAIDAAQLLGSRIVMTGISPEGAQTLTKLGISFSGVISRATLRAGVAEAFTMLGRRVVKAAGGKS